MLKLFLTALMLLSMSLLKAAELTDTLYIAAVSDTTSVVAMPDSASVMTITSATPIVKTSTWHPTQPKTPRRRLEPLSWRQFAVPGALMTYGTLETVLEPVVRLANYNTRLEVLEHRTSTTRIDDYLQYVPAASVYGLNLVGVRGRHNFRDRTIIFAMSGLFTAITVNGLKYTVRKNRPDGSQRNSFPSGHTAMAFMGAEFLYQEYRELSSWIGVAGYTIAATTGALRIYNNRHWVGDVFFGAGLGMLCTKLSYYLFPRVFNPTSGGYDENSGGGSGSGFSAAVTPFIDGRSIGLSAAITF